MPLKHWQAIVKLTDEELEQFRYYVPTIPNDWYSVVKITQQDDQELLVVEQHYHLASKDSEAINQNLSLFIQSYINHNQTSLSVDGSDTASIKNNN